MEREGDLRGRKGEPGKTASEHLMRLRGERRLCSRPGSGTGNRRGLVAAPELVEALLVALRPRPVHQVRKRPNTKDQKETVVLREGKGPSSRARVRARREEPKVRPV